MEKNTLTKQTVHLLGAEVSYWTYNPQGNCTIVMVHGFRGDHHGLEDIIDQLPTDCRVVVPDLPGFGESKPLKGQAHDINGYTKFLHEFIKTLKLTQPPILLGHSFGSIVAAHFAAEHPSAIEKLILINPIASPALRGPRAFMTQLTIMYYWLGRNLPERIGLGLLSNRAIIFSTSLLLVKTRDKKLRKQIHKNHLRHFSTFQTRDVVLEAFNASVAHTAADYAEKITAPTLLIAGELDDIAPAKYQYTLKKKLNGNSTLIVIPKVGHLIHHEAPQEAAEAIATFCKS